jgi:hypothetical protein
MFDIKKNLSKGWYLIWDPNSDVNRSKLINSLNNKCATWEYKAISKRIQYEIAKKFPDHFEYVDGIYLLFFHIEIKL